MDEKIFFVHFFMQSNGLYIRVIDEKLFKTTKEVTALTRDIDYIVDKFQTISTERHWQSQAAFTRRRI